ncbi:hypothetical protein D918_00782 [Trichuris suis]|nr:hypothetical protein D918_00782 [Trichuris suis]
MYDYVQRTYSPNDKKNETDCAYDLQLRSANQKSSNGRCHQRLRWLMPLTCYYIVNFHFAFWNS